MKTPREITLRKNEANVLNKKILNHNIIPRYCILKKLVNSVMVRVLYGNVVTERKYDVNYRILLVIFMRFFLTLDWFLETFMSHHILFCRGTSLTFGNCMQWKESKNDDKYLLEKVCSERKEKMIIDMNI